MTERGDGHAGPGRGSARPDVLICAGLDPSGGAGLIADVRVVSELGGRPVGVVTALTVQNTTGVFDSEAVGAAVIREQLELLLSDVEVRAVKLGMFGSGEVARSIGQALALTGAPLVWDPVLRPSRGDVAFAADELGPALAALLPHVTVLTPNVGELAALTGATVASLADAIAAGRALATRLSIAVLVKGGHLAGAREAGGPGGELLTLTSGSPTGATGTAEDAGDAPRAGTRPASAESLIAGAATVSAGMPAGSSSSSSPLDGEQSIDVLCRPGSIELLRGPRVPGGHHVHGTGCALSSALATYLALGVELVDACRAAKAFVAVRIADPARPGRGAGAIL